MPSKYFLQAITQDSKETPTRALKYVQNGESDEN